MNEHTHFFMVGRETPLRASAGFALMHSWIEGDEWSAQLGCVC